VLEVEARLSDVTAAEAVVSANLTRAARLRQSILKEGFAGRLVPQDPADEPASVLLDRIRASTSSGNMNEPNGTGRTPRVRRVSRTKKPEV
jgi:type I restriction enzyme, S subunit